MKHLLFENILRDLQYLITLVWGYQILSFKTISHKDELIVFKLGAIDKLNLNTLYRF